VRTRKDPDTLRGTDICYFTYERVPKGEFPEGLLPIVPDMAIEVRSPSERWTRVFAKVLEYLEAGVRVVIVLDPATATASHKIG
jgi:Uma2 family endonuclease